MADYPDFEGNKSNIYPAPDWQSYEDADKTLTFTKDPATFGQSADLLYVPGTGKTLYIYTIAWSITAKAAADGDAEQQGRIEVFAPNILGTQLYAGGNGGFAISLSPPIKVGAGESFIVSLYSKANHDVVLMGTARGYEV